MMYGVDAVQADHFFLFKSAAPVLAGQQEKGRSNTQENPCYVNFLSTEKTNGSLNATVIPSCQKINEDVLLLKLGNMAWCWEVDGLS